MINCSPKPYYNAAIKPLIFQHRQQAFSFWPNMFILDHPPNFVTKSGPHKFGTNTTTHTDWGLTEAGVMCEIPVESVTLPLLIASAPAGTPQADGDVGGTAVTVVRCYIWAWVTNREGVHVGGGIRIRMEISWGERYRGFLLIGNWITGWFPEEKWVQQRHSAHRITASTVNFQTKGFTAFK